MQNNQQRLKTTLHDITQPKTTKHNPQKTNTTQHDQTQPKTKKTHAKQFRTNANKLQQANTVLNNFPNNPQTFEINLRQTHWNILFL